MKRDDAVVYVQQMFKELLRLRPGRVTHTSTWISIHDNGNQVTVYVARADEAQEFGIIQPPDERTDWNVYYEGLTIDTTRHPATEVSRFLVDEFYKRNWSFKDLLLREALKPQRVSS